MAFNGSGTYVLPGAALVDGQTISATEHNTLRNDMATAFTTCVTRDGQSPATANLPMGGFKLTGLAAGTGNGESVRYEQAGTVAMVETHAATSKTPPVDADELPLADSAASFGLKKLTFANLWAWIQSKLASPGPIGATTPSSVKATTLHSTGTFAAGSTAPAANRGISLVGLTLSGSASQFGQYMNHTIGSDCTTAYAGIAHIPSTEAAAFTLPLLISYRAQGFTLGAGSAVTTYYAFYADAETDATNNYGMYFANNSGIGGIPNSTARLRVYGINTANTHLSLDAGNSVGQLFYLRNDGLIFTGTAAASPYNNTTATAANMVVDSSGFLSRSTSSIRFKTGVEDMQQQYAEALVYQSRPVYYRSTCEADNPLHSYWGFIAEELALIDPRVVQWGKPMHTVVKDVERERFVRDADGNKVMDADGQPLKETYIEQVEVTETNEAADLIPDGVAYERFVVALVKVAQEQKAQIDALEARLTAAGL